MEIKLHKPETYKVVVDDGKRKTEYELPLVKHLPASWQRQFAEMSRYNSKNPARNAAAIDIQLDILDEYAPGLTERITTEQMTDLIQDWIDKSGMTVGE